ncbi:helix-turn-helix transcriptional regulator [Spirochaeta lutea]|uniref:HTH luxR-type domain-containing protein n=1 Tax=Spirochaeta lutea TaxID=1480694 RepID=A0A098QTN8_9SPIO|nr:helix-turn-helix transcriptional regulator [Spirochaeta lutea]KGE70926.1 hypothetical protein DC28_13360 [Spirochaeta lutea]
MSHILFFLYILLLAGGTAGVASLAILHYRLRHRLSGLFLFVNTCLVGALFLSLVSYYLKSLIVYPADLRGLFGGISYLLGILVYGGTAVALLPLPGTQRAGLIGFTGLVILAMGIQFGFLVTESVRAMEVMRLPLMGVISGYLAYLGWTMIRVRVVPASETLDWLVTALGWVTLVFALGSAGYYLAARFLPVLAGLEISLDYIVALAWSGVSVAAFLRYLRLPQAVWAEEEISPAFIKQYGITARELDVIRQVSRGLSNKQIAQELGVSFTTIRTHLYNIFQKTGVQSRVELLRCISGYRE